MGGKRSEEWGIHDYENSLELCLPPLSLMVFKHDPKRSLLPEDSVAASNTM
jgi:1,4-alpha-glucan branching enzyme